MSESRRHVLRLQRLLGTTEGVIRGEASCPSSRLFGTWQRCVNITALLASYRPKRRSIGNTKRPIWPGKAKRVRRKPSTDVGHRDRESQIMIMMRGIATVKAES